MGDPIRGLFGAGVWGCCGFQWVLVDHASEMSSVERNVFNSGTNTDFMHGLFLLCGEGSCLFSWEPCYCCHSYHGSHI